MISRFQLAVYPDQDRPFKVVDRKPDVGAKNRAYDVFKALDALDPADVGAEVDEGEGIPYLQFAPDAQEFFYDWWAALEAKLRSNELPAIESHLSKYRSLMPSLALLLPPGRPGGRGTRPGRPQGSRLPGGGQAGRGMVRLPGGARAAHLPVRQRRGHGAGPDARRADRREPAQPVPGPGRPAEGLVGPDLGRRRSTAPSGSWKSTGGSAPSRCRRATRAAGGRSSTTSTRPPGRGAGFLGMPPPRH